MRPAVDRSNSIEWPSYNENYVRFTVYDVHFDVTRRYTAPIGVIGRGTFGFVISMRDSRTGEDVAVKKVPGAFLNAGRGRALLREIRLLRHLEHAHIIGLRDVIRPPRIEDFHEVLLVMDKMDYDLHRIIRSQQELSDDHCQHFVYQILCGLKYMHSANVIHRDLKPNNLLVDLDCTLKICDFGLARRMSENAMTEAVVTLNYRAPELLMRCQEYTKAIDIWSVGCILMEILTRRVLFEGRDEHHQLQLIIQMLGSPTEEDLAFLPRPQADYYGPILTARTYPRQSLVNLFPGLNPDALDLAERMLLFNADKRISVEDALAHPYLRSRHDPEYEPTCDNTFDFHEFEQGELANVVYYQQQIWAESCLLEELNKDASEMTESEALSENNGHGKSPRSGNRKRHYVGFP